MTMNADNLCDFHSLPGVEGGKLKGPMARSVSGFRRAMVTHRAVSSAGSLGAVMVWLDDAERLSIRAQIAAPGAAMESDYADECDSAGRITAALERQQ